MTSLLSILAVAYVGFSILMVWSRPGLLVSVCLNSYGLAVFFGGGVGAVSGAFAAAAAVLYQLVHKDAKPLRLTSAEVTLAAWTLLAVFGLPSSLRPELAWQYISFLFVLALTIYTVCRIHGSRRGFLDDIMIGSCVGMMLCVPALIMGQRTLGRLDTNQLTPVGLASIADVPLVTVFVLAFFRREISKWFKFPVAIVIAATLTAFAVVVATRSVFIAAGILAAEALVLAMWHARSVRILGNVLIVLVVIVAISPIIWSMIETSKLGLLAYVGFGRVFQNFGDGGVVFDSAALGRIRNYEAAWRMFLAAPIFGNGIGSFGYMVNLADAEYPHNMLLELLSEFGLLGTALYGWTIVSSGWDSLKSSFARPVNWEGIFLLMAFTDIVVRQQFSGNLEEAKMLYAVLGVIAARHQWEPARSVPPMMASHEDPESGARQGVVA